MHVRFERSDGMIESIDKDAGEKVASALTQQIILGPFEWVQLTYHELRVAPDGDVIAYTDMNEWLIRAKADHNAGIGLHVSDLDAKHPFSDVVIY